ncbi:MAG TPA: P1 family peptidase, partial [Candidatus Limnocylindrales bacterium]|nr:P1 family peptidase [Candidatus Limnocylindrales bacterium]
MRRFIALFTVLACCGLPASARTPVPIGTLPAGAVDGITDVRGVRVAHVTKVAGTDVRTGATAVIAGDDVWNQRVAAATYVLNGNGEMTGAHWVDQSGFLEVPVVLTNTLNVGRADDGVVSWLIAHHPGIGRTEDVPLPVVAECDDQGINDIQGRHVHAEDVVAMLDAAKPGDFPRGNVGAGTGMRAFG